MTPFDSRTRDKAAEVAEEQVSSLLRASRSEYAAGWNAARYQIAAAIRALPAASPGGWMVPEGYKLVPVEPTPEMVESAVTCSRADVSYFDAEETYRAMLEAAPPPPSQDGDALG